jgi:hypothetical protein
MLGGALLMELNNGIDLVDYGDDLGRGEDIFYMDEGFA